MWREYESRTGDQLPDAWLSVARRGFVCYILEVTSIFPQIFFLICWDISQFAVVGLPLFLCTDILECAEMPRLLCVIQERTWMQSPTTANQCIWASFIRRNHRVQPIWSPTDDAHPGKTTFAIMLFPLPGKYMKCHISTRLALTYDFY